MAGMRLTHKVIGATVLAVMLAVGAHAGTAQSAPPTTAELKAWHEKIVKVPKPSADGCFTSGYPLMTWRQARCKTPPAVPMVPKPAPRPMVIGNGNDISARAPFGLISEAWGFFDNVMNVTSVSSPIGNVGPPVADAYTVQFNTNYFPTVACIASPNIACQGWQQFIFANDGTGGEAFIQYWLLRYNATCPLGWNQFQFTGDPDIYCWRNSPSSVPIPNQPISNLDNIQLYGGVSGLGEMVDFADGVTAYMATGGNYLNAAAGWHTAEFNIFGYGGNSSGGGMATFNSGASMAVRNRINFGGGMTPPPICVAEGYTGETNNLSFGTPPPVVTPPFPSLMFLQNTTGGAVTNCAAASVNGDTHQLTFSGLAYDFQAAGDFVEAQAGSAFEVQTRKVSGAPGWPNTSLNQSVATRIGGTKVAVCEGKRLVIDGRTSDLPPDGVLSMPSGVTIHRMGNKYIINDQSGNSVTVTDNNLYVDVEVGLGTWPAAVRGLLGNPGGDVRKLEAKDGTQFTVPISFQDLYSRFGDSWRVSPIRTLLAPCASVAAGNPPAPFFAQNLDPELRQWAEGICRQTKVPAAWLSACTLDVAVVGERAAQAFVGRQPPVLDGNPLS
jgi:hypothetical protein